MAVANPSGTFANPSGTVSILMGNGDGTFQLPAVSYDVDAGSSQIVAGDFSGNGILDLAVASADLGTVSILMGNGDGTFQPRGQLRRVRADRCVAGDFSGNGMLDLAVASLSDNSVPS